MATVSMMDGRADDEAEEGEFERFDDFTLASSWERFISEIEAICRRCLADGPKNLMEKGAVSLAASKNLYKAKNELKYDKKSYCMEYYFQDKPTGPGTDVVWDCTLHDLQLAFGVTEFLIIAPQSASGVVLDSPEGSKLLSAVAIALTNCCSTWPAFVPVHDPSRKAHIGIQNMGTVFTRRFESDCIGSQVPVKLMHLEGLYEMFVSKFAVSTLDFSMHLFKVQLTMKLTYKTLPYDDDDYMQGDEAGNTQSSADSGSEYLKKSQWDNDCPWSEWYSAEDPIRGLELITIWSQRTVESSLEMAEIENSSPHEAEIWLLLPTFSLALYDDYKGKAVGFASQLSILVNALEMSFQAQFLEDFVSVESSTDNLKSPSVIPPPTVVDRVLKELFHEGLKEPDFTKVEHKSSRAIKGAPLESLFARFCLHALWFGDCSIRAIATLWIEFVREVRWYWEESQPLPKMPANGTIDLSTCLINQKLQMLAICIEKKREANPEYYDATEGKDDVPSHLKEDRDSKSRRKLVEKFSKRSISPRRSETRDTGETGNHSEILEAASDRIRKGSADVAGSMMLLYSRQRMHAPFTQNAPPMTEDMHEERLHAIEAFSDSSSFHAQLEREILSSDMSAFKAANPDAAFQDFIRWHSPGDWESSPSEEAGVSGAEVKDDWPPKGRLSNRMSDHGNFWRKLWNDAPALPAYEQKPLVDPNREGEKILHYLETLRPHQLLEQMVSTAFRASADTLNRTTLGDLNEMKAKIDQLYLTLASMLRPLQANQLSQDSETFVDLKRTCVVFEHVEKLIILAASLHRKFIRAPRLCRAMFSDFYNFYLPRMGKSSAEFDRHQEFDKQQQVRINERHVVVELFTPPTPNQSWRKVLSMGNLLNGHEPVLREIIFSMHDNVSGNHYAAHSPMTRGSQDDIETYRMYICGTSNDLRVALSVVSCD